MEARKRKCGSKMNDETLNENAVSVLQSKYLILKDAYNIALLLFLYFLQGIPLGLASSIPLFIQGSNSQASYETLANFSLVFWPFSLKLAWAPFVDSIYIKKFGRRKSWLLPVQYAIGIDLIFISLYLNDWLQRPVDDPWGPIGMNGPIKAYSLTTAFFFLTFLASTQDIVVDGWALTMLSRENVGWASTCNTVGQTLGHLFACLVFMALESPEISNTYFRSTSIPNQGIVSAPGFILFWAIIFIVTNTLVAIFKSETDRKSIDEKTKGTTTIGQMVLRSMSKKEKQSVEQKDETKYEFEIEPEFSSGSTYAKGESDELITGEENIEDNLGLFETYAVMFGVLRLKPILVYIAVQFMVRFSYSSAESLLVLKLIELGASKETLVFMTLLTFPIQVGLPILLAKWSSGPKPLSIFSICIIPRLLVAMLAGPLVYSTSYFRISEINYNESISHINPIPELIRASSQSDFGTLQSLQNMINTDHVRPMKYSFGTGFYALILGNGILYTLVQFPMYVSQMAFNAKVSDPAVGGTYMTLLNTACNLAGTVPQTLMMYFVDPLTSRSCTNTNDLRAGFASLSISEEALIARKIDSVSGSPLHQSTVDAIKSLGRDFMAEKATCKPMPGIRMCNLAGGTCVTHSDGFYIELGVCLIVGLLSYTFFLRRMLNYLDNLPREKFRFQLTSRNYCARLQKRSKAI